MQWGDKGGQEGDLYLVGPFLWCPFLLQGNSLPLTPNNLNLNENVIPYHDRVKRTHTLIYKIYTLQSEGGKCAIPKALVP